MVAVPDLAVVRGGPSTVYLPTLHFPTLHFPTLHFPTFPGAKRPTFPLFTGQAGRAAQPSTFTALGLPEASVTRDIFRFQWFAMRLSSSRREISLLEKLKGAPLAGRFEVW